jgi:amidohydrolase
MGIAMSARARAAHFGALATLLLGAGTAAPGLVIAQQHEADRPIAEADIDQAVERSAPAMIQLRHRIHQHPELGNREFETSKLVAAQLRSFGLDVQTGIAYTGVVGTLRGGRPGPVVAVRSELDALQVTEESPYPFKSTVRTNSNGHEVGVAHACGHDIHIAGILGVAAVLSSMRSELPGTVIFVFQPAEEGPPPGEEGGAMLMLKEGLFDKVKPAAVFGMHSYGTLDVGQIRYALGPTTSASSDFRIEFHGKQAHAGNPQESIDPVLMAAEAVLELQTIRSRNLSPFDPGALSVTMVNAGVRPQIIPETATLGGTIRVFDEKVVEQVERRMREIVEGVARGAGGSAQVEFVDQFPPVVSEPALVKRMLPALERVVGRDNVRAWPPVMGADDFAYFSQVAPAFFFFLGTQKPGTVSGGNHATNFQADDSAIPLGIQAMTSVLLEYLRTTPRG